MQLRPKYSDSLFVILGDDEDLTIHFPHHLERMSLAAKGPEARDYKSECGAIGQASWYLADEYDLDADWCEECVGHVEESRKLLASLKSVDISEALEGFMSTVPVHIVKSPRSASPDKI